jgi:hypothetical protein
MTLIKEEKVFLGLEAMLRLSELLAIYGTCPYCHHKLCPHCSFFDECADPSRLLPENFNISFFPPEMSGEAIHCCTCRSDRHLIEWLRIKWRPVLYEHAKAGESQLGFMVKAKLLEEMPRDGLIRY